MHIQSPTKVVEEEPDAPLQSDEKLERYTRFVIGVMEEQNLALKYSGLSETNLNLNA